MGRHAGAGQRMLWALSALFIIALVWSCDALDPAPPPAGDLPKIVVLGFDGVDPDFLGRWMAEGKLPNLKRVADAGVFARLGSTNPPQSPVAWSTFATGMNPGKTGIYDFIRRDPTTYLPGVATSSVSPPTMKWGLWVSAPAEGHNPRRGQTFWKVASDAGVRVTVVNLPYAFPPDDLSGTGRQLSGLGTPDLLGTNSTFFYYGDDLDQAAEVTSVAGGRLVKLDVRDGRAEVQLKGPQDPSTSERRNLMLPVSFALDRGAGRLAITLDGREVTAKAGEWTPWIEFAFRVSPFYKIHGICRFYVIEAGPGIRVYGSPLNYDPRHPFVPFSSPGTFAGEIADAIGLYKTVGWEHDTSSLNAERVDEKAFLEDAASVEAQREEMLLRALDAKDWDLFLFVSTGPDRVSHMFFRLTDPESPRYDAALARKYGDAIEKAYVRMDHTVGKVLDRLPEGATLVILSDHGFHSFNRGLHTNTWLVRNGYMKLRPSPESPEGRWSAKEFLQDVDWSATKAYALGTGQVYLNVEGRERDGIVPADGAEAVARALAGALRAFRDPASGEAPLQQVYLGSEIFPGADPLERPDLQLAFRDGWRTSWETMLGGIPDALTGPNTKKWSGDHAASDVADTAGILLVNQRLKLEDPRIGDLAPTILHQYEVTPPPDVDGHRLW
ncbi:MAG: alkaline phosphatase family protein [Myxococcota bacterium]